MTTTIRLEKRKQPFGGKKDFYYPLEGDSLWLFDHIDKSGCLAMSELESFTLIATAHGWKVEVVE